MKEFPLKDVPEFSQKKRIVVVGVIGKSSYRYPNKTTPLLSAVETDKNQIKCYWDERASVLYLHATTYLDTSRLTEFIANLNEDSTATDKNADPMNWLTAAGELAVESCRLIALIFNLSHIVVLSSPTPVFDLGYLQLFRAIDSFRLDVSHRVSEALASGAAGSAWETHGRTSCPRLLFHFHRGPRQLRRNPAGLKRLEHAVEDQLYFVLRKARIITNVCAKSLFAIPKNEEFVYISANDECHTARDVSNLVQGLVRLCGNKDQVTVDRPTFKQFLQSHIDLAFSEGFDDNVGKYAMSTSFFELPSAFSWRKAALALSPVYLESGVVSDDDSESNGALYDALATDVRFSRARCAKVLPIAQASYLEGMPSHYSSQHHAHKMLVSLSVFGTMARGPLCMWARDSLSAACEAAWRARRLCEALSLTHHPCREPVHDSSVDHCSGVRYVSACNCGRSKSSREDPYSVRRANSTFYATAAEHCTGCNNLQMHEFPVFQPSTPTYKAALVKDGGGSVEDIEEPGTPSEGESVTSWPDLSPRPPDLSPEHTPQDPERTSQELDLLHVAEHTTVEKSITRQPSTTEYLPYMLHTDAPLGFLPSYCSWSLVCLGASSLYSHSLGLPEHLQPGFLPHTNFLLPWDCAVRMEQAALWRSSRGRGNKHQTSHHLTVKIFIGFEYECPRGHRFMMSSRDTVVSGGGGATSGARTPQTETAIHASSGARTAQTEMAIYAPCPCRNTLIAHLMRIHVVTPKAPVHVTLDPKVQPVSNGPIFVPQPEGEPPVKLSPSAYWILRLPYIYCGDRGPLPVPTLPQPSGRIITPLFGLAD